MGWAAENSSRQKRKEEETSPPQRVQGDGDGLGCVSPPPRVAEQHFAVVVVAVQAHDLDEPRLGVGPVQVARHPVHGHGAGHAHHSSGHELRGIPTVHLNAPQATLTSENDKLLFFRLPYKWIPL